MAQANSSVIRNKGQAKTRTVLRGTMAPQAHGRGRGGLGETKTRISHCWASRSSGTNHF